MTKRYERLLNQASYELTAINTIMNQLQMTIDDLNDTLGNLKDAIHVYCDGTEGEE